MHQLFRIAKRLLNIQLTTLYFFTKSSINLKENEITLDSLQRKRIISAFILIFLSLWVTASNLAFAKDVSNEVPENATAKTYGDGWNCNQGYRVRKGACIAVTLPANAYLTNKTYRQGWECQRSFLRINNTCVPIKVPINGYLDYSGIKVKCERGYLLVNKTCEAIKVPANGYLKESSFGPGWTCERGYRASKGNCIALKIPKNAHIGFSGKVWECNKPYIKKQDNCILPVKY